MNYRPHNLSFHSRYQHNQPFIISLAPIAPQFLFSEHFQALLRLKRPSKNHISLSQRLVLQRLCFASRYRFQGSLPSSKVMIAQVYYHS
jgi:hypothetical protein